MGTPTSYFVDPLSGSDSTGDGTIGTPWESVQHALNNITRDSTNGDKINVRDTANNVLGGSALTLATYGTPSVTAPLWFRGYSSTEDDGGIGVLDGNAQSTIFASSYANVTLQDIRCTNSNNSASGLCQLGAQCNFIKCEFDGFPGTNPSNVAVSVGGDSRVIGCHFHNLTSVALSTATTSVCAFCYFKNDGSNTMTTALRADFLVYGNIFSLSSTTDAIFIDDEVNTSVYNNSFFTTGTGKAIILDGSSFGTAAENNQVVMNNIFEGWGTGISIENDADGSTLVVYGNAAFNCSTAYSIADVVVTEDNEELAETPFAKSGADSFANRSTYFAPLDVGNILSPYGGMFTAKGAVQIAGAATGGLLLHPGMTGHMFDMVGNLNG